MVPLTERFKVVTFRFWGKQLRLHLILWLSVILITIGVLKRCCR